MISAVDTLSLAYYLDSNEQYATQATYLLRTWFLDEATHMKPNLKYAQVVPGRTNERGGGIIDAYNMPLVVDSVGLLAGSKAWTENDQRGMQKWFTDYLDWLQTSKQGQNEGKAKNNHVTFYASQIAVIALFLGKMDLAEQTTGAGRDLVASQIQPDGTQPLELNRTKAWDYSVFNLEAFFRLAALGDRAGVDLWTYKTADGRSLRGALNYLVPFAFDYSQWPFKQISGWNNQEIAILLRQAATRYHSADYLQDSLKLLGDKARSDRSVLLYPASSA